MFLIKTTDQKLKIQKMEIIFRIKSFYAFWGTKIEAFRFIFLKINNSRLESFPATFKYFFLSFIKN
jgi:hypothetical protein